MKRLSVLTFTLLLAAATLACGGGHHDADHATDATDATDAADTPAAAPEERVSRCR